MGDFVVQELINPIDYVMKVYVMYDKTYFFYLNTIDLDAYEDLAHIDGSAHLKTKIKSEAHKNEEISNIVKLIISMMQDNNFICFGIDLICPVGTKDFYLLDINPDAASWSRFFNSTEAIEIFRQGLKKVAHKH